MANISLENLARYDGKIKEYVEDKYLSKNTANWQMTEKAGAVTCYPVPDTELEPIVDFSFKEVPPASGDKSPSNPSTIEGVSSILVATRGKNVLNPKNAQSGTGWSIESDGTITLGTITELVSLWFYPLLINIPWPAGTYTIEVNNSMAINNARLSTRNSSGSWGSAFANRIDTYLTTVNKTITKTFPVGHNEARLCLSIPAGEYSGATIKIQFEVGAVATAYETPIVGVVPTISLGNTYYGGSVNLATGLMTVTHNGIILNGTENWVLETALTNTTRFYLSGAAPAAYNSLQICSHFNYAAKYHEDTPHFYIGYGGGVIHLFYPDATITLNDLKTWFASQYANNTPVTIIYELLNPYTVQLNPVQIKSLTALDKNTPRLNTLYTDADSIQVGYQKHPARTSYELENAILALGGGE